MIGGTQPIQPWHLREAARCIRGGGLVAYPTEAVYGLGCDPLDRAAVTRLLVLKRRRLAKGLILIAADFEQLHPFVRPLVPARMAQVLARWPGPDTWVLPAADAVPTWLRGAHDTLAVRVTAHPVAAALCRACARALVSTSANPSGYPPARTPLQVRQRLPGLDYILHAPLGGAPRPSTIRDGLTGKVLRA